MNKCGPLGVAVATTLGAAVGFQAIDCEKRRLAEETVPVAGVAEPTEIAPEIVAPSELARELMQKALDVHGKQDGKSGLLFLADADNGTIIVLDAKRCVQPNRASAVVVNDVAVVSEHNGTGWVGNPADSATYAMMVSADRVCPGEPKRVVDEEIVFNREETAGTYSQVRAAFVALCATVGITVTPDPWNSAEAKRRAAEMFGTDVVK